jgi:hypothetical protein
MVRLKSTPGYTSMRKEVVLNETRREDVGEDAKEEAETDNG